MITSTRLMWAMCMLVAIGAALPARAGGIPVIDVANLAQTVQQVLNDVRKIQNQSQQIAQLQQQLSSINGQRKLGHVFDNPALRNYVPPEAYGVVNADPLGFSVPPEALVSAGRGATRQAPSP